MKSALVDGNGDGAFPVPGNQATRLFGRGVSLFPRAFAFEDTLSWKERADKVTLRTFTSTPGGCSDVACPGRTCGRQSHAQLPSTSHFTWASGSFLLVVKRILS